MNYNHVETLLFVTYIKPLMNIFQSKLQIVSVFGAGLLVGTALAVIIPEGVRLLYSILLQSAQCKKFSILEPDQHQIFINLVIHIFL